MASNAESDGGKTEQTKTKHPSYAVMVEQTLFALNERQGSTRQAVVKHMAGKYLLDTSSCQIHANKALKAFMESNTVASSTGDLKGKFKLSKERKEELKKLEKKIEKKVAGKEAEKVTAKPPKPAGERKKKSESKEDKENVPAKKEKQGKATGADKGNEEKETGTKKKNAVESRKTLKKSASMSQVDDMQTEEKAAAKVKGRKKASESEDVKSQEEVDKKGNKRGPKKKAVE